MNDPKKTFLFKVKFLRDKRIYRIIEILGGQTLDNLHSAIIEAYDFDSDHLYSFFMNNKAWSDKEYEYCSPYSKGRHADTIRISDLHIPKKFLYLYDFGDEWKFEVEFQENGTQRPRRKYPRVIKIIGESPEQYGQ